MEMEPQASKRPRIDVEKLTGCLCHGYSSNPGKLEHFTPASWSKFCGAALHRKDSVYFTLQPYIDGEHELPKPLSSLMKHHNCYAAYVLSKSVELAERKREQEIGDSTNDDINDDSEGVTRSRLTRSSVLQTDILKCVICQNDKRLHGDRRRYEDLHPLTLLSAVETMRHAATIRNDERVLLQLSDGARGGTDAIAGDVLIHRSCRSSYTHYRNLKFIQENTCSDDAYEVAFKRLSSEIENGLINGHEVWRMSDVRDRFVEILQDLGIDQPNYRTEKLKKRILKTFGEQVLFWHPKFRSESEMLFSDMVPKGMYIEAGASFDTTECDMDNFDDVPLVDEKTKQMRQLSLVSNIVRNAIKDVKDMPWPPTPQDISDNNIHDSVPSVLFNLLTWIIIGINEDTENALATDNCAKVPEATKRQILSIAQDIVYCSRHGRIRTPKHVALAASVHHLTGSMELVSTLNRFGHCISKTKLQEVKSALAEMRLENQNAAVMPANISPNVPVCLVWDNIDFREETPSDKNTTHCTTGIVIQPAIATCAPPPKMSSATVSHKRSVNYVPTQLTQEYPHGNKRTGPSRVENAIQHIPNTRSTVRETAHSKDFVWFLSRLCVNLECPGEENIQTVPGWCGFYALVRENEEIPSPHKVGYLPVIDEPPTDLNAVYTLMQRSIKTFDIINSCNNEERPSVVLTCDQAVYAKAFEIYHSPLHDSLKRIVLRMGGFHIILNFLAVIGRRFGSAGLRDVLIESDVLAMGSVDATLDGHHYNRGIRGHKLAAEAMGRLRWTVFVEWNKHHDFPINIESLASAIDRIRQNPCKQEIEELLKSKILIMVQHRFSEFCSLLGPNGKFWSSYIEIVDLLVEFIRSTREADWELHIQCLLAMIPWFAAYDRTNYTRYLPAYVLQMLQLPQSHPDAHTLLMQGEFAVQRSTTNTFGRIPHDQTIEVTVNRDTKSRGGIIGITLNPGAVFKWMVLRADHGEYLRSCREMSGQSNLDSNNRPKDAGKKRIADDEAAVQRVETCISNWINPFQDDQKLCHLASGRNAPDDVASDLMNAHDKGEAYVNEIINDRLDMSGSVNFYAAILKRKLKTFASLDRPKMSQKSKQMPVLKSTRELFARLLVIGQNRKVSLKELLTYSLGPFPLSIATPEGNIVKTVKSSLLRELEKNSEILDVIPPDSVYIIDAMAVLQALRVDSAMTYKELASLVFSTILRGVGPSSRLDWVVDTYPEISIKNPERDHRTASTSGSLQTTINSENQRIDHQFKKSLRSPQFKQELTKFLMTAWQQPRYAPILNRRSLYLTNGEECLLLEVSEETNQITSKPILELFCNHKEADSRILLHASHAAKHGSSTIVIKSPDTDVAVMAIGLSQDIPAQLIFSTGTSQRKRNINLTGIGVLLGPPVCKALIGYHAFSGCDSTSAFVGRGKVQGLKLVKSNLAFRDTMSRFGTLFAADQDLLRDGKAAICALYGHDQEQDVNKLRHAMFGSRTTEPAKLPPCKDACQHHIKRANYQAAIWRHSLEARPVVPSPHNNGWIVNENISPHWLDLPAAPDAILECVSCKCQKCSGTRCTCKIHNFKCTGACLCDPQQCENRNAAMPEDQLLSEDDSDIE